MEGRRDGPKQGPEHEDGCAARRRRHLAALPPDFHRYSSREPAQPSNLDTSRFLGKYRPAFFSAVCDTCATLGFLTHFTQKLFHVTGYHFLIEYENETI